MQTHAPLICSLLLATLAAGCDAKAGDDYEGESLLTLRGSVVLGEAPASDKLAPAIAFVNHQTGQIDIMDVQATGSFPAAFSLSVQVPPPNGAFSSPALPPDYPSLGRAAPSYAVGYVTAVRQAHPSLLFWARNYMTLQWCQAGGTEILEAAQHFPERADGVIPGVVSNNDPSADCYTKSWLDFSYESRVEGIPSDAKYESIERCRNGIDCSVVWDRGDPRHVSDPYRVVVGLSNNYIVLYLREPAPAGSGVSRAFGSGQPLSVGYHLLASRAFTPQEEAANEDCRYRAQTQARTVPLRDMQSADDADFDQYLALGCELTDRHYTRIEEPDAADISVTVGTFPRELFTL